MSNRVHLERDSDVAVSQEKRHVNSCFFTMVADDDDRRPVRVPELRPGPGNEARRFDEAILRKRLGQELGARFASIQAPS